MGSISIGVKRKPTGKVAVFAWSEKYPAQQFVAVDLSKATVRTVKEFCANYIDKEYANTELQKYYEAGCKYVLETRYFNYGYTKVDARGSLEI